MINFAAAVEQLFLLTRSRFRMYLRVERKAVNPGTRYGIMVVLILERGRWSRQI